MTLKDVEYITLACLTISLLNFLVISGNVVGGVVIMQKIGIDGRLFRLYVLYF